ncbi:hypothetical protein NIES4071_79310 [Calothrix sp. NIES-4071]|nr:hypothetical protein NIES4071_79310 [Calothrix sp. NIES-4071]BAZ62201.1 hypothetical protein NIES4105_79240 [Calothrix sp. NIES-4105]
MTSNIFNFRNFFEVDGIHLAIWEPNLIVLAIPDNNSDSKTRVEIKVDLRNNTAESFYLSSDQTLSLEFLAPDGEVLQAQLTPGKIDESLLNRPIKRDWGD